MNHAARDYLTNSAAEKASMQARLTELEGKRHDISARVIQAQNEVLVARKRKTDERSPLASTHTTCCENEASLGLEGDFELVDANEGVLTFKPLVGTEQPAATPALNFMVCDLSCEVIEYSQPAMLYEPDFQESFSLGLSAYEGSQRVLAELEAMERIVASEVEAARVAAQGTVDGRNGADAAGRSQSLSDTVH